MPPTCPDCSTGMYPADDMNCEKANWICPECAPDFVLTRATTHVSKDSDQWAEKYKA